MPTVPVVEAESKPDVNSPAHVAKYGDMMVSRDTGVTVPVDYSPEKLASRLQYASHDQLSRLEQGANSEDLKTAIGNERTRRQTQGTLRADEVATPEQLSPDLPKADEMFPDGDTAEQKLPTADALFPDDPLPAVQDTSPVQHDGLLTRLRKAVDPFRTIKAAGDGMAEGFGSEPIGMSMENRQKLADIGLFPNTKTGEVGGLRPYYEAIAQPFSVVGDLLFRGVAAGVTGLSNAFGQVVGDASGDETQGAKAKREAENFANFLMIEAGGIFSKPGVTPAGRPIDITIGRAPDAATFRDTAMVLGNPKAEAPLRQLYHEKGIMPGEVAADAAADVTIRQDIIAGNVPRAYTDTSVPAWRNYDELIRQGKTDEAVAMGEQLILRDAEATGGGAGKPPKEPPPAEGAATGAEPPKAIAGPEKPMTYDDAAAAYDSRISVGDHDATRPMTWQRFYTAAIDDLNPVKVAEERALKKLGEGPLEPSESPYSLFRLTRGTFGKADHWLEHGTFDAKTYVTNGDALKTILEPVKDDLQPFRRYITARRAAELDARGIESGFDPAATKAILKEHGDTLEPVHRALVAYQNRLALYLKDAGLLSREALHDMLKANRDYVPFFRVLDPTPTLKPATGTSRKLSSRNPLKSIEGGDLGIVDPLESVVKNTYAYIALAEKNMAGVKLVELLERADAGAMYTRDLLPAEHKPAAEANPRLAIEGVGDTAQLEKPKPGAIESSWKGADGEIIPPEKSIIEPVSRDTSGSKKTWVDAEFSDIMDGLGPDLKAFIRTASEPAHGEVIRVFKDGKVIERRVNDPDLVAAWRGLDQWTAAWYVKMMAVPASALRAGVTLSPEFMVRNIIGDYFSAVVNSKGAIFSPVDTLRGAANVLMKTDNYKDFLKGGGANSAMVSIDRAYIQDSVLKLRDSEGFLDAAWNVIKFPVTGTLRAGRMLGEFLENATRVGEFVKQTDGFKDKGSIQNASMAAREITVDYARIGSQMRAYNMVTAFANATIQGSDRLVRAMKENPVGTSTKIAAGIMVPTATLWYWNHTDPVYQALPRWQKDLYWVFISHNWENASQAEAARTASYLVRQQGDNIQIDRANIYRMRKPYDAGIIFGAGLERSLEAFVANNPDAYKELGKSIMASLSPGVFPTISIPMLEQWSNKSLFNGSPVVNAAQERQLPEYQYTENTTELAKAISRAVGYVPGVTDAAIDPNTIGAVKAVAEAISSPAQIENYVRNWTGGMGQHVIELADYGLRKAGMLPDQQNKPLQAMAEYPVIKAFMIRHPSMTTTYVQDFYDGSERADRIMATWQAQIKAGNMDAAQKVSDTYGLPLRLTQMRQAINGQVQLIHRIYADPGYTPEEKRQNIDATYFRVNQIAQLGNNLLKAAEEKTKEKLR